MGLEAFSRGDPDPVTVGLVGSFRLRYRPERGLRIQPPSGRYTPTGWDLRLRGKWELATEESALVWDDTRVSLDRRGETERELVVVEREEAAREFVLDWPDNADIYS